MNQKYLKKVALALRNNSKLLREEANVIRNSNNQKIPGYLETWNNTTNELEILEIILNYFEKKLMLLEKQVLILEMNQKYL